MFRMYIVTKEKGNRQKIFVKMSNKLIVAGKIDKKITKYLIRTFLF